MAALGDHDLPGGSERKIIVVQVPSHDEPQGEFDGHVSFANLVCRPWGNQNGSGQRWQADSYGITPATSAKMPPIERLKLWAKENDEMRGASRPSLERDRHRRRLSIRHRRRPPQLRPLPPPPLLQARHRPSSRALRATPHRYQLEGRADRSSWEIADWAGTSEAMVSRIYRHRL